MSNVLADGLSDLKTKGVCLAIAAIVATVVLEMMMRIGAPNMLGIPPMSPANLVTNILGLPLGHVVGTIAHFGLGLIVFPIGYVIIAYRHFPGPYLLRSEEDGHAGCLLGPADDRGKDDAVGASSTLATGCWDTVDSVAIAVSDMDRALPFYTTVLPFELVSAVMVRDPDGHGVLLTAD